MNKVFKHRVIKVILLVLMIPLYWLDCVGARINTYAAKRAASKPIKSISGITIPRVIRIKIDNGFDSGEYRGSTVLCNVLALNDSIVQPSIIFSPVDAPNYYGEGLYVPGNSKHSNWVCTRAVNYASCGSDLKRSVKDAAVYMYLDKEHTQYI